MDVLQKVFITIMNLIVTLKRSITWYLQYRAKKKKKCEKFGILNDRKMTSFLTHCAGCNQFIITEAYWKLVLIVKIHSG